MFSLAVRARSIAIYIFIINLGWKSAIGSHGAAGLRPATALRAWLLIPAAAINNQFNKPAGY